LNPYAPPVHAPDPHDFARSGESALRIQFVLQIVMAVLHGLIVLSVFLNVALLLAGVDLQELASPSPSYGSRAYESGRIVGRALGFLLSFAWGFGGAIWCAVNASAIHKRKPWTYTSLRAYWIAAIASCCCAPFGIFGLIHLSKPELKYVLGRG